MRTMMLVAALVLAGDAAIALGQATGPVIHRSADPKRIPEVRPLGRPVACVPLGYVKDTLVQSDGVIDYVMSTRRTFRNELPQACTGLAEAGRFGYAKGVTQLCAGDSITVAPQGGEAGATCTLGQFHPVELVQRRF